MSQQNSRERYDYLDSSLSTSACEKSVEQIVDRIIGLRESELTLEVLLSEEDDVRRWKEQGRVVERMKDLCNEYRDLIQNFVNEAADKKNRCVASPGGKMVRRDSAELEELVEMAEAVNRLVQATVLSIHDRTRGFKERRFDRTRIWLSDSLKQVRLNVGGAVNALAAYIARNKYKAIGVALLTGWAAYSGVLSAPIRIFASNLQIAPSKMQAFMWSLHEVLHKSCSTLLCNPVGLVFIAVIFGGALLLRLHKPLYQLVFSGGGVDAKEDAAARQDAKQRQARVYDGIFRTELRNRKKEREAAFQAAKDYVEHEKKGIDEASLGREVEDAIRSADLIDLETLETRFQSKYTKLAVVKAIRKVREASSSSLPSMDPSLTPIAERILNRTGSVFSVDSLVVLLDKVYRALVLMRRPSDALKGALPTDFLRNLGGFTPPGVNDRFMSALHMLSRLMGASPFTSLVATFGNPILSASGVACNALCGTSRVMGGIATTIHTATDFESSPVLFGVNAVTFLSSFVGILFKFGGIGSAAINATGIGKVTAIGSALFKVANPALLSATGLAAGVIPFATTLIATSTTSLASEEQRALGRSIEASLDAPSSALLSLVRVCPFGGILSLLGRRQYARIIAGVAATFALYASSVAAATDDAARGSREERANATLSATLELIQGGRSKGTSSLVSEKNSILEAVKDVERQIGEYLPPPRPGARLTWEVTLSRARRLAGKGEGELRRDAAKDVRRRMERATVSEVDADAVRVARDMDRERKDEMAEECKKGCKRECGTDVDMHDDLRDDLHDELNPERVPDPEVEM